LAKPHFEFCCVEAKETKSCIAFLQQESDVSDFIGNQLADALDDHWVIVQLAASRAPPVGDVTSASSML
jgi:hypothetical protein